MSLKARLRRIQTQIDWLKIEGRLRHVELQFKMLDMQKRIERRLRQHPDDERVQRMARAVGLNVPPPKPEPRCLTEDNTRAEAGS